jgi:limonene-1,2-epoxide hydrolase
MQITTAINLIENGVSSIFSKQDVLDLLRAIDASENSNNMNIRQLASKVADIVAHRADIGIVDEDSTEFGIEGGNGIVLEHIEIDADYLCDLLVEAIEYAVEQK